MTLDIIFMTLSNMLIRALFFAVTTPFSCEKTIGDGALRGTLSCPPRFTAFLENSVLRFFSSAKAASRVLISKKNAQQLVFQKAESATSGIEICFYE